jgi:hypothetical protein
MKEDKVEFCSTFSVGEYTCTIRLPSLPEAFEFGVSAMNVEWLPDMPKSLSKSDLKQYREKRDEFLALVAQKIGGGIAVVDV